MRKIAISAGHSSKCPGMSDVIDEVTEARRVCTEVCDELFRRNIAFAGPFFDDVSTDKNECLERIVSWHNSQSRDLDVSIHFNANAHTSKPVGTECWYYESNQEMKVLAKEIATDIAENSGLINRGPKPSDGLYFLVHTNKPAVLVEICFGDSVKDCELYEEAFHALCYALAGALTAEDLGPPGPEPTPDLPVRFQGRTSWFGGPDDTGVSPSEGLAFLYEVSDAPDLFLPTQPPGTSGLARRLDPETFYAAARWDYDITPKEMLRDQDLKALVRAKGGECLCRPADWGPHEDTGRAMDLSPGLMEALGLTTDDEAELIYPAPDDSEPEPEPEPERSKVEINTTGPVDIWINGTKLEDL